jgi:OHCU decarboxylase
MDRRAFVDALGSVVEHSPWVAERAWELRPFRSRQRLQLAFETALRTAPAEERLQVLRAHPELARRETPGGMTGSSQREQHGAGLDRLSDVERSAFRELNARYRERFGFPFISCVGEHSVTSLLAWGAVRLERSAADEAVTAVAEVGKIVGLRLGERVSG